MILGKIHKQDSFSCLHTIFFHWLNNVKYKKKNHHNIPIQVLSKWVKSFWRYIYFWKSRSKKNQFQRTKFLILGTWAWFKKIVFDRILCILQDRKSHVVLTQVLLLVFQDRKKTRFFAPSFSCNFSQIEGSTPNQRMASFIKAVSCLCSKTTWTH